MAESITLCINEVVQSVLAGGRFEHANQQRFLGIAARERERERATVDPLHLSAIAFFYFLGTVFCILIACTSARAKTYYHANRYQFLFRDIEFQACIGMAKGGDIFSVDNSFTCE